MPSLGSASIFRMFSSRVPAPTQMGLPVPASQVGPPVEWITTMSMACVRTLPVRRALASLAVTVSAASTNPITAGILLMLRTARDSVEQVIGAYVLPEQIIQD